MQRLPPVTSLTRKTQTFNLTEQCQTAFETLTEYFYKVLVLMRAQPHQPFIVTTDASNTRIGVLSRTQKDGETIPLGYFSKKVNSTEGRYSATDNEDLAVVLACRHFHHYIWDTKFTTLADYQLFTSIFKKKTKSPRMKRWIMEMRKYHYEIKYVQGKYNYVADQLSRPLKIVQRCPTTTILGLTSEEFIKYQRGEVK